jgi:hypothetical protein
LFSGIGRLLFLQIRTEDRDHCDGQMSVQLVVASLRLSRCFSTGVSREEN